MTDVMWHASETGKPSDHVPVYARLQKRRVPDSRPPRIPGWVTGHPMFPKYVEEIEGRIGGVKSDPFEAIDDYKSIFRIAASKVKRIAILRGARTTNEKLYWSLLALRTAAGAPNRRLREAMEAHPPLRSWIDADAGRVSHATALCDHIATLT
eukprot:16427482-Heterocapsa_arctica.AAC.1